MDNAAWTIISQPGPSGIRGNQGLGGQGGVHGRNCVGEIISSGCHHWGSDGKMDYWDRNASPQVRVPKAHVNRGNASNGNPGTGTNITGLQTPPAQNPVDKSILQVYKAYYNQELLNPLITPFIKEFSSLK